MGTTNEKLAYLLATKEQLKTNLAEMGINVTDDMTFRELTESVLNIETEAEPLDPVLQSLSITPDGDDHVYTPDDGFDGFSYVEVEGDGNLVPENIVSGIEIYGVEGTADVGSSSEELSIPYAYSRYVEYAKTLYSGDYSHIAIAESPDYLSIHFLTDNFELVTYDADTSVYTATGIVFVTFDKKSLTWGDVVDNTTTISTGVRYLDNWTFSEVDVMYGASKVFDSKCYCVDIVKVKYSGATVDSGYGYAYAQLYSVSDVEGNGQYTTYADAFDKMVFNGTIYKCSEICMFIEDDDLQVFGNPSILEPSLTDTGLDFVYFEGMFATKTPLDYEFTMVWKGRRFEKTVFDKTITPSFSDGSYGRICSYPIDSFPSNLSGYSEAYVLLDGEIDNDRYNNEGYYFNCGIEQGSNYLAFGDSFVSNGYWQERLVYAPIRVSVNYEDSSFSTFKNGTIYLAQNDETYNITVETDVKIVFCKWAPV